MAKNACFQNSLTNTCENKAASPVFSRGFRGYCRNEISPFRALTQLVLALTITKDCTSRNEISPFRALTLFISSFLGGGKDK